MDRREVEVRQRMELTRTNRSAAYPQVRAWERGARNHAAGLQAKADRACVIEMKICFLFGFEGMDKP